MPFFCKRCSNLLQNVLQHVGVDTSPHCQHLGPIQCTQRHRRGAGTATKPLWHRQIGVMGLGLQAFTELGDETGRAEEGLHLFQVQVDGGGLSCLRLVVHQGDAPAAADAPYNLGRPANASPAAQHGVTACLLHLASCKSLQPVQRCRSPSREVTDKQSWAALAGSGSDGS